MAGVIDLDHLELYVCGDAALRDEILTIFTEQAEMWMSRLDPGLPDEEWRNAAHALKGASRGVGAWSVGDLCEAAEKLVGGDARKAASRRAVLSELNAELELAVAEAREHRDAA
ncbi:MAG: Hpt domain-containing protein [Pseudomonadota bacterium]|nr:Hpt domain-containing protein [Pseudomonadota bacterium]